MIHDVVLPQLGMGMSEGTITEWLVDEASEVVRDQPLVLIETEKVETELPAPYSGIINIVVHASDELLPIETVIARIADTRAEYDRMPAAEEAHAHDAGDGTPQATTERAQREPSKPAAKIRASGLAKALAREHGVDLADVTGSGPSGRIVREDVETIVEQRRAAPTGDVPEAAAVGAVPTSSPQSIEIGMGPEKTRLPITGVRKVIAERMVAASTEAAQTFSFFEIDVTGVAAWRERLLKRESELGSRISFTAIYAKALSIACGKVPICNATTDGDEIILWEHVNLGVAVALPGRNEFDSSLIVPVIRDVGKKGILEINEDIREIVAKARNGQLTPHDTTGATITMSSTAGFALEGTWMVGSPLLNLPQVVNFGPGSMVEKPVVVDGAITIRTMLPCGLVFDHRAMDGAPATEFIRILCQLLQEPESMLL
jgi:pyruvate dehydrogenase E2 component (dihydrolipoamide acetyltransferase)